MALYTYKALSRDGKQVNGQLDAASVQNVKDVLVGKGLFPVVINISDGKKTNLPWYKKFFPEKKVTVKDKILFTKQFSVLLKSGIPVVQSLELMSEQFEGGLKNILIVLKDDLKEGLSLADSFEKYSDIFGNIYIQLVRAGEATGKLEIILDRLTTYLEKKQKLRKKITTAMTYPMIQLSMVVLVVIILLTVVVPQISQTFVQQGRELPLPTRILLSISSFMQSYYIFIFIFLTIFIIGFKFWKKTNSGAYFLDKLKLKLPIVRFFSRMGAVTQFSRTLGMLTESGVSLSYALDIVCNIVNNKVLANSLLEAKNNIIKEGKIAQYLKRSNVFPPVAIYLIKTGEESGELGKMLNTVAENYEDELSELADSLASKIEPVMMIIMAVVVGFIVASIMLPLMDQVDISSI